ncbi:MAG: hypothetical protein H5T50_01070 [Nitrososphaeria archaeon]|nr:hypothetical protein [Nitrososphaeria archaeon]
MKPKTFALTLAVIAIVLAYLIILAIQPYPTIFRRHVDPNSETEKLPYQTYLTTFLLFTFDELVKGNFTGTILKLKEFNQTYVPASLKYIFERFRQLMNDLTVKLDDTDIQLDYAESLIYSGREEDARTPLKTAGYDLAEANITYSQLKSSAEEFTRSFMLPRAQVFQKIDSIQVLIEDMYTKLYNLLERIEFQKNLEETYLEIEAYPESVWVGSTITVEGKLYTKTQPLTQKNIIVYFDGQKASEARTSSDGMFNCTLKVPYTYKPQANIIAKYFPLEDDSNKYKPTESNTIQIQLLYITPKVEAKLYGETLPGKYFRVEGKVYAEKSLPYDQIKISWLTSSTIVQLENGTFKLTLKVPESISDGKYVLKAEAPSSGIYAPASKTLYVNVKRIPLNLTLDAPPIAFSGIEYNIVGKILYQGEEKFNSTIKLVLGQEYVENVGQEFKIKFTPPLTIFSGYQVYRVQVKPQPPWYSSVEAEGRIFIINPITVAVPVGLVSAVAVKILREEKRKNVKAVEKGIGKAAEAETVQVKEKYYVREGLEWLINIYWQAVVIVSNLTRIEMKPSMTIREYLALVKESGKEFYKSFEKISMVAEKALYSPKVSEEELEAAKKSIEELQIAYARIVH